MKVKISKSDYIWSYVGYFFTLFTNIIILPFVMKLVPSNELGLWYTFLSIGQFVNIFDNTFTISVSRNITYAWSGMKHLLAEGFDNSELKSDEGPNYRLLISIVQTCRVIFGVISVLAMILMLTVGIGYLGKAASVIDRGLWIPAWLIYACGVFLNLYYSYWLTALRGVGAIKQAQKANVASKITQIALSLAGLFFGGGIIALCASFLLSGLVMRVMAKRSFMAYEQVGEAYKRHRKEISREEIKDNFNKIWFNAKKNGINAVSTFAITQTTTLICSAYLGLTETASYGLSLQIITAIAGVAMIYFSTVKPKITELKIGGEATRQEFINCMSLSVFIYWVVFLAEMVAVLTIGLSAIKLLRADTEIPFVMIAFMGLYLFLENNHSIFCGLIEMSNTVPYVRAGVISAGCIALGEFVAVRLLGTNIYGLMFVQFVVQLAYNNWHWPMMLMKEYDLTIASIFRIGYRESKKEVRKFLKK